MVIKSLKIIFFENIKKGENSYYDKAIWSGIVFFIISQMADLQYFEGRISLTAWLFLVCLKKVIDENQFFKEQIKTF